MMGYKTILLPLQTKETADALMSSGLLIAGHVRAHLQVRHVRAIPESFPPADFYSHPFGIAPRVTSRQSDIQGYHAKALRESFEAACARAGAHIINMEKASSKKGLTASWTEIPGYIPEAFAAPSRLSDLCIWMLPGEAVSRAERQIADCLLMESASPLLLMPGTGIRKAPERIIIAWDGSLQAARALKLSIPFLQGAAQTLIITVGAEDFQAPGVADVADFLALHGVRATSRRVATGREEVARRLLGEAKKLDADMIVSGGYSHARIQEQFLGGVTRYLITHADLPLFLAH